ncbi:MAG: Sec-independent protein translocase protein TatB [Pseudomonadota bacterium]
MFDIGFVEIMLIGIVSMLVVGPERLPEVARNVGKWVGKARRYVANVRRDFESELNNSDLRDLLGEQEAQIKELRGLVDQTKRDIGGSVDSLTRDLEKDVGAADSTPTPTPPATTPAPPAPVTPAATSTAPASADKTPPDAS